MKSTKVVELFANQRQTRSAEELAFLPLVGRGLAAQIAAVHPDWRLQADSDPAVLVPAASAFLPDFRGAQARQ